MHIKEPYKKVGIALVIILFYFFFNFFFNFNLWHQVIHKENPQFLPVIGEWPIYEHAAGIVKENILAGKNPFTPTPYLSYPFGWNFTLEDVAPINGFYFLFLRPFFSVHQSFALIILIGMFVSNITMFLLLRRIGVNIYTSLLVGLVFGYSPFAILRLGHPTYTAFYLFPLSALFFLLLKQSSLVSTKTLYSFFLGISLVLFFYTNLYFTFMAVLMCIFLIVFYFMSYKKESLNFIKQYYGYIFITAATVFIFLIPWFLVAKEIPVFDQYVKTTSWVDSIAFSADLFGLFIPANFASVYGKFFEYISTFYIRWRPGFENVIYPGIIVLCAYFYFIFYRKTISKETVKKINPLFFTGIVFWILTLGPFLHVFDKRLPILLPFAILNKIPYAQIARAPGRFIVPFLFLGSIIAGIIIGDIIKNKIKIKAVRYLLFLLLFCIFLVDQSYVMAFSYPLNRPIPSKIYSYLATQGSKPLLEIPFSVRDGLQYVGDYNTTWLPLSQRLHKQKIFSIYGGRISNDVFEYHKKNYLLSTISDMINNPSNYKNSIENIDTNKIIESINFFNIEHVILKKDEEYSQASVQLLEKAGFKSILDDNGFILFYRKTDEIDFYNINTNSDTAHLIYVRGWSIIESTGRWATEKNADLFFKLQNKKRLVLRFIARSLVKDQTIKIYVNSKKINEASLNEQFKQYKTYIDSEAQEGINTLEFTFSRSAQPAKIFSHNKDYRNLSVLFSSISLEKNERE